MKPLTGIFIGLGLLILGFGIASTPEGLMALMSVGGGGITILVGILFLIFYIWKFEIK